jgi:hypothetical protein
MPDRKLSSEEQLTENLKLLQENPCAEILPVTEGYLAWRSEGRAGLAKYLNEVKAEAEARRQALLKKYKELL